MKHVGMSQSATLANEAMRRWKSPKVTPVAELTRGTAIATSRKRLRTQLNPHAPRVKREPLLRIWEKKVTKLISCVYKPFEATEYNLLIPSPALITNSSLECQWSLDEFGSETMVTNPVWDMKTVSHHHTSFRNKSGKVPNEFPACDAEGVCEVPSFLDKPKALYPLSGVQGMQARYSLVNLGCWR